MDMTIFEPLPLPAEMMPGPAPMNAQQVDAAALPHLFQILRRWLPLAEIVKPFFVGLRPTERTIVIHFPSGTWWQPGERESMTGQGAISLAAHLFAVSPTEAAPLVAGMIGAKVAE